MSQSSPAISGKVAVRRGDLSPAPDGSMRLTSLDALRGFDMFWIAGGSYIVAAVNKLSDNRIFSFFKTQLTHVDWEGFHFYDLIFPLFVFITGVSLTFSVRKTVERHGKFAAIQRILLRGLLLFLMGIFYSGGLTNEWPEIRLMGVLQRIALSYVGAGTLFVLLKPRWLIGVFLSILIGYAALLEFSPVRNFTLEKSAIKERQDQFNSTNTHQLFIQTRDTLSGSYEKGLNLPNHIDYQYLPGRLYDTYYDPEGLLSTLPAVASCLLGVLAGIVLGRSDRKSGAKTSALLMYGLFCLVAGYVLGFQIPIIKKIWTSTFVLVAGGYSMMLLAAFYYVIDVTRSRTWCQPFVWIGMNSITIYFAAQLLRFPRLAERLVGGTIKSHLGGFGEILVALVTIALLFLFARALYRRNIFLRL